MTQYNRTRHSDGKYVDDLTSPKTKGDSIMIHDLMPSREVIYLFITA